jgi:hypothetical protein
MIEFSRKAVIRTTGVIGAAMMPVGLWPDAALAQRHRAPVAARARAYTDSRAVRAPDAAATK